MSRLFRYLRLRYSPLVGSGIAAIGTHHINTNMKKPEDIIMHPLWIGPMMLMFMMVMIQTLHTLTHWHMEIDADAWCKNNAEWVNRMED